MMENRISCFTVILALFVLVGCKSADINHQTSAPLDSFLLTNQAIEDSFAFQIYKDQPKSDIAKIRYLVNLVRYSEYTFIRNGEAYSGQVASRWLEYKINRYSEDCDTIENFIEKVGTFSRKTQKEYIVVYPNGDKIPMKVAFRNEMNRLNELENPPIQKAEMEALEKVEQLDSQELTEVVADKITTSHSDKITSNLVAPLSTLASIPSLEIKNEK